MPRGKPASDAARLARLGALSAGSPEQVREAVQLLAAARTIEGVGAALAVLIDWLGGELRPLLLARYRECAADGVRRDPGAPIRVALLAALRGWALPEDVPILERAALTYEFLFGEEAGDLRAAALLALNEVDDRIAAFHCVRLLGDEYTSRMSGEPAVTAARVLAMQGQVLPLYGYVLQSGGLGEVVGECLRGLKDLPEALLEPLIERYLAGRDQIVLLGLFDLLLARDERERYWPLIEEFLATTTLIDLYRSLVATLVAARDEGASALLDRLVAAERDSRKSAILREVRGG